MDLIGQGRALRVCDVCGRVDDHPRHSFAGVTNDEQWRHPSPEIVARVAKNISDLTTNGETANRLMNDLLDTRVQDRHMDCCRSVGCPTGHCNTMPDVRGAELLGHLDNTRETPGTRGNGGPPSTMTMTGLMLLMLRLGLYTVGLSSGNLIDGWLNVLRNTTFTAVAAQWIQLHTGDPGASGTSNVSSVTTRMQITWSAPSGTTPRSLTLSASVSWTNWAGTNGEVVSHLGLFGASSAGTFYSSFALTTSRTVNTGDTVTLTSLSMGLSPVAA